MADRLTGRVLESVRIAPQPRPTIVSRVEPTVERVGTRPSLPAAVAVAVVAAVVGRRNARKQKKVMAVFLVAGVVIVAVWRPVVSAFREHRYSSRWSQQPLGW